MGYIDVPIEVEPVDVAEEAFSYLEEKVPTWTASPGNLEAWLIEALALTASELRELTGLVPEEIFAYFGESILGLPPYAAQQATGTTTWTAMNTAGYTIAAGTLVGIQPPGQDETYAFEVVDDTQIASGQTVAAGVTVRALEAGTDASEITGTVEMLDPLDYIVSVTLNVPTSGGADAETTEDYLDRLSELLTLLTPRPILPQDYSVMVQQQFPYVDRATTIDLYKLDTQTPNTPRCVTVIVTDAAGEPVTAPQKAEIDAYLQAQREVNMLVFVGDPTYTTIAVTFTAVCYPGYVAAEVEALAEANVAAWLSPANWGRPPFGDPGSSSWVNETKVRYLEVAEQINRTDGVNYISALSIGIQGGSMGQTDVSLTGVAPLTRAGTINGTVTAP